MSISISDLSTQIWINELNQSDLVIVPEIAYWIRSKGVGMLNSLLYKSYSIDADTLEITPDISLDEAAILSQLYVLKFIQLQIDNLIGASGLVNNQFIEWSEKGHTIRKINRNEISKSWIELKKQAKDNLEDLISSYKVNRSGPRQVVGIDCLFPIVYIPKYNRVIGDA